MKQPLYTTLCEWCSNNTKAVGIVSIYTHEPTANTYLCKRHSDEVWSEFNNVNIEPLTSPAPEYTLLESGAEPMTGEWTIKELETAARYGAPYPVCGDLTTRKHAGKSWTGHDPNGTQY